MFSCEVRGPSVLVFGNNVFLVTLNALYLSSSSGTLATRLSRKLSGSSKLESQVAPARSVVILPLATSHAETLLVKMG